MLVELFKMSGGNWGVYDIKANKVATVPHSHVQLLQTLKFRLIVAVALYSLLSMFGNLSEWLRIGGTALFYGFITFYYYQRALPSLKWQPLAQLTMPQQQDVSSFFQPQKVLARIGFTGLISILAILAFQIQPHSATGFSLEQIILVLLTVTMLIETIRQSIIFFALKK